MPSLTQAQLPCLLIDALDPTSDQWLLDISQIQATMRHRLHEPRLDPDPRINFLDSDRLGLAWIDTDRLAFAFVLETPGALDPSRDKLCQL